VLLNLLLARPRPRLSVRTGIVDAVTRRSLLVIAGWCGAVLLAVLVGLGAINVIGAGLTSSGGTLKSSAEVERELAALPSPNSVSPSPSASFPASPSPSSSASPSRSAVAAPRSFNTRGGTVVASCAGAGATITSMSPESGFAVHERHGGEGEFRSTSDNHDRVKFSITCSAGHPTLSPRGGGGDD
jgi:hypothetical protein